MDVLPAFANQAAYCAANGAPVTARLCREIAELLPDLQGPLGERLRLWPGQALADALPLRLIGGLNAALQAGELPCVARALQQPESEDDPALLAAALRDALIQRAQDWLPWLEGPPQTNETGRSAALMGGLIVLACRFGFPFDLLEIGSSAGLNLLMDRFAFNLGGVISGPQDSPVRIAPLWRGPAPPVPPQPIRFARLRGVDCAPLDVGDPEAVRRLRAYIWMDQPERLACLDAAIALAQAHAPDLQRGDAAEWVETQLMAPAVPGTMRVLVHSIVWQYLDAPSQNRIRAAMARAGAAATSETPLGWVALEADRATCRHELVVRAWPPLPGESAVAPRLLARAHPHGSWVDWGATTPPQGPS